MVRDMESTGQEEGLRIPGGTTS